MHIIPASARKNLELCVMLMLLEKDHRTIYLLIMILAVLQHMKLAIVLGLHIYGAMQIAEVMKLMTLLCTILPILVVQNKDIKHLYRNSIGDVDELYGL